MKSLRAGWTLLGLSLLVAAFQGRAAAQAPAADSELATRAMAVLQAYCSRCHGGPAAGKNADRGGFDHVLDVNELVASGLIVRFSAADSELLQRVRDGEMPPSEVEARPGDADIAVLEQWIARGAPAPVVASAETPARGFISRAEVERRMAADLTSMRLEDRRHVRYITLVHLHNASLGSTSEQELELARKAVAKLINSLSWQPRIHVPVAIDSERTIYRIDLRAIGWSREHWERLVGRDPYALIHNSRDARAVYRATGTLAPQVRADWLVAAASRPPLYHALLGLPDSAAGLERHLGIDVIGNIRAGRVARAGFNRSGVSRNNRVIERHALSRGGYYWRSYDFQSSSERRNIFDHPLGPTGAPDDFEPDGGEIIFSLPNGLQAYMLVDQRGRRIDKAPTAIVVDPSRTDSAVENGISCMGCHSLGIIDKRDQIRAHIATNRAAFDQRNPRTGPRALALYPPRERMDALLSGDRAGFEAALDAAGARSNLEPIDTVDQRFAAELDLSSAAAELDLQPGELTARLERHATLRRNLGALLVRGGTIKRDVFQSMFATAVTTLGLGQPLVELSPEDQLERVCEDGGGSDCVEVGDRFFHGQGVARDEIRAATAYRKACDRDSGHGCTAFAIVVHTGRGVRADPRRASRLYQRGCDLGDLRGCELLGVQLATGDGVSKDGRRAESVLQRACTGGRPAGCKALGDVYHRGLAGVAKNRRRGVQLYERACQAGAKGGCVAAARVYGDGEGIIKKNRPRAAMFHRKACDAGVVSSCMRAAELYYDGDDMREQRALSAQLFGRACEAGDADGCYRLAKQLDSGKGVRKDKARARELFERACRLGKNRACLR